MLKSGIEQGEVQAVDRTVTVQALVDEYLAHLRSRIGDLDPKRRRAPRTVELYAARLEKYVIPGLGAKSKVATLNVSHVRRMLDQSAQAKLAPATRHGILVACSSLLSFAVREGMLRSNPARELDTEDRPSGTVRMSEPRYLSTEQIETLLDKLSEASRPIAAVCALAGLRISEALGLTWADVAGAEVQVRAQLGEDKLDALKTVRSRRDVPMVPRLATELRQHRQLLAERVGIQALAPERLVFQTRTGKPLSRRNVLRAVQSAAEQAGIEGDVGLHDLRHSFAALALTRLPLTEVSALLGHASVDVTARVYAGVVEGEGQRKQRASLLATALGESR